MGMRRLFVVSLMLTGCVLQGQVCAQVASGAASQVSAAHRAPSDAAIGATGAATPPVVGPSASASGVQPNLFERGLALVEQVLKVLAYLVGGAWVYFNYFRGRTHRPRLETRVACEQLSVAAPVLLRVTASAKNAGLSKVDLTDQGSGAVIHGYELTTGTWKTLQAYSILTKEHQWIEPGETILDEILVRLDAAYPAFLVELWLNSTSKVTWVAKTIVGPVERKNYVATGTGTEATAGTATAGTTATATAPDADGSAGRSADRGPEKANPPAATTGTSAAG